MLAFRLRSFSKSNRAGTCTRKAVSRALSLRGGQAVSSLLNTPCLCCFQPDDIARNSSSWTRRSQNNHHNIAA